MAAGHIEDNGTESVWKGLIWLELNAQFSEGFTIVNGNILLQFPYKAIYKDYRAFYVWCDGFHFDLISLNLSKMTLKVWII